METESHFDLDDLLLMYEESWDKETEIFVNHLNSKKRDMEKISFLEKEVEVRRLSMENSDEQTRPDYNKLEEIYRTLKAREALYDIHLKCTLLYEPSNVFKISFLNDDSSVRGWIRFEREQTKNNWIVLEIQPPNVMPKKILDQFCQSQDTQDFLSFFRHMLFNT